MITKHDLDQQLLATHSIPADARVGVVFEDEDGKIVVKHVLCVIYNESHNELLFSAVAPINDPEEFIWVDYGEKE